MAAAPRQPPREERWSPPRRRDGATVFGVDGSGAGVAVTVDAGPQEQLVELAEHVQERAVEALPAR